MYQNLPMTVDPYLRKVYGDDVPDIADKLLKTTYTVYSESVLNLYSRIQQHYKSTGRTIHIHFNYWASTASVYTFSFRATHQMSCTTNPATLNLWSSI